MNRLGDYMKAIGLTVTAADAENVWTSDASAESLQAVLGTLGDHRS